MIHAYYPFLKYISALITLPNIDSFTSRLCVNNRFVPADSGCRRDHRTLKDNILFFHYNRAILLSDKGDTTDVFMRMIGSSFFLHLCYGPEDF